MGCHGQPISLKKKMPGLFEPFPWRPGSHLNPLRPKRKEILPMSKKGKKHEMRTY